jgi:hypothetical protein
MPYCESFVQQGSGHRPLKKLLAFMLLLVSIRRETATGIIVQWIHCIADRA